MRRHERFEWDQDKADENLRKHGVSFEDAAEALADEMADHTHIEEYDNEHSQTEER